jgi:hypothetical protein
MQSMNLPSASRFLLRTATANHNFSAAKGFSILSTEGAKMKKSTIFAVLGLAAALALASPQKANAGVIIGVGVGPRYARPAYGYVVGYPRPYGYYARPYVYAPGYVRPAFGFYGRFGPDRRWAGREWVRNGWVRNGNDRGFRGWDRGYRR